MPAVQTFPASPHSAAGHNDKPQDRPSRELAATVGLGQVLNTQQPPRPTPVPLALPDPVPVPIPAAAAAGVTTTSPHHHPAAMIFSDLYKSPKSPLSKLRHTNPVGLDARNAGYDADLLSKDKTRQKEAIKRVLAETVRNDWEFKWPRPGVPRPAPKDTAPAAAPGSASQGPAPETSGVDALSNNADPSNSTAEPALDTADENELESSDNDDDDENDDSDTESVYSCMSEDLAHYQPRLEWTSDLSDDEPAITSSSPFRFNNPDSVGMVVRASAAAKQAKRRRAQRSEMEWNDGLACFNARRDAWTGARTVRVKPSATSPTSPTSPRRSLWRLGSSKSDVTTPPPHTDSAIASANASPPSPGATHSRNSQLYQPESAGTSDGYSSSNSSPPSKDSNQAYPVKTLIPVPRPLLPVGNPMRASISPAMYTSLYDKVVVASLQPSCPINLADMIRSCVVGWKRDGEWPPRPMEIPAAALVVVRKKKEDRRDSAKDRRGSAATLGSTGRRLSLGGLLGRATADDKEKDKDAKKDGSGSGEGGNSKSFRRSIQRVLGIGHGHSPSTSANHPKEPAAV